MYQRKSELNLVYCCIDLAVFLLFFFVCHHFWQMTLTEAAAGWALGSILVHKNRTIHDGMH